jgi:phospholipid-binding lipoprotein MlaA
MHRLPVCVLFVLACLSTGCAAGPNKRDPLESINRKIYRFNEIADRAVLKPIAKGYAKVIPDIGRRGVTNFFGNLGMVVTTLNDVLQLKGEKVPVDVMRFVTNTVFGLGGLIDVASELNIEYRDEDFGQTLGYWGVGSGPYVVVPFLGPSSVRDGTGLIVDFFTSPYYSDDVGVVWGLFGMNIVNTRANLLPLDNLLAQQIDPYTFLRDTYLQRREYLIRDGARPPAAPSQEGAGRQRPKSLRELEEEEFGDEPVDAPQSSPDGSK